MIPNPVAEPAPKSVNPTDHEVLEAVAMRWSPRAFSSRSVEPGVLGTLFEAARWAASSNNEQPWRFIVATRKHPEGFARMLSCLKEGNQSWAKDAPVLMVVLARPNYTKSGGANKHAWHDTGQAVAQLALQAAHLGLGVHQMGGIHPDRAADLYAVPEPFEVVSMLALGYPGDPAQLPEDLRAKESRPRERKPLSELVFSGSFGSSAEWTG